MSGGPPIDPGACRWSWESPGCHKGVKASERNERALDPFEDKGTHWSWGSPWKASSFCVSDNIIASRGDRVVLGPGRDEPGGNQGALRGGSGSLYRSPGRRVLVWPTREADLGPLHSPGRHRAGGPCPRAPL